MLCDYGEFLAGQSIGLSKQSARAYRHATNSYRLTMHVCVLFVWLLGELFLTVCMHFPQTHVLRRPSNCLSCSMDIFCRRVKECGELQLAPPLGWHCVRCLTAHLSACLSLPVSLCFAIRASDIASACSMFYYSFSATCWKVINDHQYKQRQYLFKDTQGQLENPWAGGWHYHKSMTYSYETIYASLFVPCCVVQWCKHRLFNNLPNLLAEQCLPLQRERRHPLSVDKGLTFFFPLLKIFYDLNGFS